MFWKKPAASSENAALKQIEEASGLPPRQQPSQMSSAEGLTRALHDYRQQFLKSIDSEPDSQLKNAQALVDEAKDIVTSSGLGSALAPTLLEEVKYWPSWSQRDDFSQYVHFPTSDVMASRKNGERGAFITTVYFTYKNVRYGVVFRDAGMSSGFGDGAFHHGEVEFISDETVVLGLNISLDLDQDYSEWRWFDLFAFQSGKWAEHLIEIAALIEMNKKKTMDRQVNEDLLARAKNIKL